MEKQFSTVQIRKTLERARQRHAAICHAKPQLPWWGPKLAKLDSEVVINALERLITVDRGEPHEKKEKN